MQRSDLQALTNDQLIDVILEQQEDLKVVKDTSIKMMKVFGVMNDDGTQNKGFSVKKIGSVVMQVMANPDGFVNKVGDLSVLEKLATKYQHLWAI